MSHDYDNDLENNMQRRSRRNPRLKGNEPELDVMGDPSIKPVQSSAAGRSGKETTATDERQTRSRAVAGNGAAGQIPELSPRQQQQLERRKKRRRMIVMIVAECITLACIFGYAFFARMAAMIQRPEDFEISQIKTNDIAVEAAETMKGYWTIAIFGVDARDKAIVKGTNADVNMICNINRDTGEIRLVSVFRDTYLNISENGSYNKLNQAYFVGGPEQAISALNRNLDLSINDYMTFNWKAVADAINVLGGVDIELSKAEFYYINSFITETVKATGVGSYQLTHAGMNHLDGVQAVAYGRLRLMDTDYARTERQRKVIAQAFEKAKQADFQTLYRVIGTVFPQVSTSIWVDDLVTNAQNISKFHLGETTGFPQARGDANMGKKGAVVVPQTLESNVIKLHEFLFGDTDYTPSTTVKNISARIAADTGMYREGQYVDKVSTEGGVIQSPKKSTAASSTKADEDDDEDEDETDEAETDEDGNPIETSSKRPSSAVETETDEDGNPIETTTSFRRPGQTAATDENGDPLETSETSVSHITSDRPGTTTGTTAATTAAASPGSTAAETSSGVSPAPGSTATTAAASDNGPGSSGTTTTTPTTSASEVSQFPGSTASTTAAAATPAPTAAASTTAAAVTQGPGSSSSGTTSTAPTAGTVAAPGQ